MAKMWLFLDTVDICSALILKWFREQMREMRQPLCMCAEQNFELGCSESWVHEIYLFHVYIYTSQMLRWTRFRNGNNDRQAKYEHQNLHVESSYKWSTCFFFLGDKMVFSIPGALSIHVANHIQRPALLFHASCFMLYVSRICPVVEYTYRKWRICVNICLNSNIDWDSWKVFIVFFNLFQNTKWSVCIWFS